MTDRWTASLRHHINPLELTVEVGGRRAVMAQVLSRVVLSHIAQEEIELWSDSVEDGPWVHGIRQILREELHGKDMLLRRGNVRHEKRFVRIFQREHTVEFQPVRYVYGLGGRVKTAFLPGVLARPSVLAASYCGVGVFFFAHGFCCLVLLPF